MVLRATLVVLCIVLGLALFSSGEEYGWILAATVGVVVAGVALGIEYTLRRGKARVGLGGAARLARGRLLRGRGPLGSRVPRPAPSRLPPVGLPVVGLVFFLFPHYR